jgi:hypothetical protein
MVRTVIIIIKAAIIIIILAITAIEDIQTSINLSYATHEIFRLKHVQNLFGVPEDH